MIVSRFLRYAPLFYLFSCLTSNVEQDCLRKAPSLDDFFYSGNEYHLISSINISSINDRLMNFINPEREEFLNSFREREIIYHRYDLFYKNEKLVYIPKIYITPEENLTLIWFSSIYPYSKIPSKYIKVVYDTIKSYRPIALLLDKKACLQFESESRAKYDKFFQLAIANGALRIMLVEELEFNDKKLNELHKKYLLPNAIGGNPVVASDAYRLLLNFHDFFCRVKNTYIDFDMLESVLKNNLWKDLNGYTAKLELYGQQWTCSKNKNNNDIIGAIRVQIDQYRNSVIDIFNNQIPFYSESMKNISNTFSDPRNVDKCIKSGQSAIYRSPHLSILSISLEEKFNVCAYTWSEMIVFYLRSIKEPCPTLELCSRLLYYAKKYSLYNKEPYILPESVYSKKNIDEEKLCIEGKCIELRDIFVQNSKKSNIEKIILKCISKEDLSIEDKKYIVKFVEIENCSNIAKSEISGDMNSEAVIGFEKIYKERFEGICSAVSDFLKTKIVREGEMNEEDNSNYIMGKDLYMNFVNNNELHLHCYHKFNIWQRLILDELLRKNQLLISIFFNKYDSNIYKKEINFLKSYNFFRRMRYCNDYAIMYMSCMIMLLLKNQINEIFYNYSSRITDSLSLNISRLIEKNLFNEFLKYINHNDSIFDKQGCLDNSSYNIFCSAINNFYISRNERVNNLFQNEIFNSLKERKIINNVESLSESYLPKLALLKELSDINSSIRNLDIMEINFKFVEEYVKLMNSRKLHVSVKDELRKLNLQLFIENDNADEYLSSYKEVIRFFDNWQDYKTLEKYAKKREFWIRNYATFKLSGSLLTVGFLSFN